MIFSTHELKEFRSQMRRIESESNLSPWERMVVTPPILIRLMARTREMVPRVLTDREIAERGGFACADMARLYTALTWDHVPVTSARRFMEACDMDIMERKAWNLLGQCSLRRRPRWSHLKRSDLWATQFQPLLQSWEEAIEYVSR